MDKKITERIEFLAPALKLKDGAGKLALLEKYLNKFIPSYWELLELDRQQRSQFKGAEAELCKQISSWLRQYDPAWDKCCLVQEALAEWEEEHGWKPLSYLTGLSTETARQIYQALKRGRGI